MKRATRNRQQAGPPTTDERTQEHIRLLGVRIDNLNQTEAIDRLLDLASAGGSHHIVTVNPEFVMQAQDDDEFRTVLESAELALADGVGLLLAARFLGTPLHGRATGTDTLIGMAPQAAERGFSYFLLGAQPGVAEEAAARLAAASPGLRIAGAYAGSPSPVEEAGIVARVRQAAPDFLFVAYGAPQQDLWIARNLARLGVPVAMGVGGAFDYISGRARRAPALVRRLGLEWLYRLVHQPWRWRRMLALPRFTLRVFGSRLRGG